MSLPDRTDRAHALANSYATQTGRDGWTRVQEYQRAMAWNAAHPDSGSSAASRALELPRGRLRAWFDGAKPDPAHAVGTAEAHGWLDCQPGERTFEALSLLVAWTYAGGNITPDTYSLTLTVSTDDPGPLARECLTAVGFPVETMHDDVGDRATDYRPSGPGRSHLGRFLAGVLNAPTGAKATQELSLPRWLDAVPPATRTRWIQLYVVLRGTTGTNDWIQLREERPGGWLAELGGLFRSVVEDDAQVRVGEDAVWIRPQVAHLLQGLPRLPPA